MSEHKAHELQTLLRTVRRRWLTAHTLRALARAGKVALGLLVAVLLTDRLLQPPDLPMVVTAALALIIVLGVVGRALWRLRRVPSNRQVARYIEERCPELEDRLASAAETVADARPDGLHAMMLADAARWVRELSLDRVIAGRELGRLASMAAGVALALVVGLVLGREPLGRLARTGWLYVVPSSAELVVEPGTTQLAAGEPLRISAMLRGSAAAPARTAPHLTMVTASGVEQTVAMVPADDRYVVDLASVDASFSYQVAAAALESPNYTVTALTAPQVTQVDVAYEYPAFTGLTPRVEEDGGDIYAPSGTTVTVTVHADRPITSGTLARASGAVLPLDGVGTNTLTTRFDVDADDSYRLGVVDANGLASRSGVEYFIRTISDRPPEIDLDRPGGDREITPLEEVVIEAAARDDFGLERFELVYTVVGREDHAVDLRGQGQTAVVSGVHTLYAEDLRLEPGDVVSYYARARDTNPSRYARETRSDMYFLEVRPFDQEFEEAQSQSMAGMQVEDLGNLAAVQKEIIAATWKLDRQSPADRSPADVTVVADAQAELMETAQRVAMQIAVAGPTARDRAGPSPFRQAMEQAVGAMAQAETALRDDSTDEAIPSEMTALNQLLKAQAQVRRQQVSQSAQGGQPSSFRAQEDLSALFDRELRRDQQTNYEDRDDAAASSDTNDSETLRRLQQLADRQEALTREQQTLAEQHDEADPEETRRRLERLTREQQELREQIEDLQRQMAQTGSASDQSAQGGDALRQAGEQMRRAASDLRRGAPSEAADRGQAALDQLRSLEAQLSGASRQALGQLQLDAQQLAETQRRAASETRQVDAGPPGRRSRERLAAIEDELAGRVDRLESRVSELRAGAPPREREALDAVSTDLERGQLAERMRAVAEEIRGVETEDAEPAATLARIAETDDALAEELDRVAERLALAASDLSPTAQQLSDDLERAQAMRQQLAEIERRLSTLDQTERSPSATGESQGQAGQRSASDQSDADAGQGQRVAGRAQPGEGQAPGGLTGLQAALLEQLASDPELLDQLGAEHPALRQDLARWMEDWRSGAAPGTERFKEDFSAWEGLRRDVQLALERVEESRSRALSDEEAGDRLNVGPTEHVPPAYQQLIDQYYRSLAATPRGP